MLEYICNTFMFNSSIIATKNLHDKHKQELTFENDSSIVKIFFYCL